MRISLCAFADEAAESITGQIAALLRNGIRKIELRSVDGVNVKDFSDEKAKEIACALKSAGITVWSIGSPLGKSDIEADFAKEQEVLEKLLHLCEIFDCKKIRVFSFFTKEYASVRDEVISRMQSLVAQAKKAGVTLYHENEKDIYGDIAERVSDLLDNVKGLASAYDPANYVQVGESVENMKKMVKRAGYYHIKDALRTGELVPAGEGDGQIPALIESIEKDTTLTLEPHLKQFSGYASIDKHEMKNKYVFSSADEAFDTAADALKKVLTECGYTESEGEWIKK